jgi:anti-sigma B factor antagonist
MIFSRSTQVGRDGVVRLSVTGDIDLSTSESLTERIVEAINTDGTNEVVIDLESVTFLDSTGIAALMKGRRLADEHTVGYHVINPRDLVRQVLEITGVLKHLTDTTTSGRPSIFTATTAAAAICCDEAPDAATTANQD